ncbi:MAG: rod-binding protein [Bdellovibrionales bacterium]|nr:rod-binding protein [Bdellovibrionales bacterium]
MKIDGSRPPAPQQDAVDPQLRAAAEGMEASFLREMVRAMRKTVTENEADQNNRGLQVFRSMLDDEYAEQAARTRSLGLSEMIVRQVMEMQGAVRSHGAVPVRGLNKTDMIGDKTRGSQ